MAAKSYAQVVTVNGQDRIADSIANQTPIDFAHVAIGEGEMTVAVETMTQLLNEVNRVPVTSAIRDPQNANVVIVTATISIDAGPFVIREIGVFLSDGTLFSVGLYPETEKKTALQQATQDFLLRIRVIVSSNASITVQVDPVLSVSIGTLLRTPFYAVDESLNTPPAAPAVGGLYRLGETPTDAWIGHGHKLAQWNGEQWMIADAPIETVISEGDTGDMYRRTADGWQLWRAEENRRGPIKIATQADIDNGSTDTAVPPDLLNTNTVTQDQVREMIVHFSPGHQ